jgi:hypothetical protein
VNVVQDCAEHRRFDPSLQQIERLNERHTRFEECCQLLVEHEELLLGDSLRLRQVKRKPADCAFRPEGEDEQSLLLEFVTQA